MNYVNKPKQQLNNVIYYIILFIGAVILTLIALFPLIFPTNIAGAIPPAYEGTCVANPDERVWICKHGQFSPEHTVPFTDEDDQVFHTGAYSGTISEPSDDSGSSTAAGGGASQTEEQKRYNQFKKQNKVKSIKKSFFMGVFSKKINTGRPMVGFTEPDGENPDTGQTEEYEKVRQKLNYKIAEGAADKNYSLYDRFGGNITFVMYNGEENVETNFADKLYTLYDSGKTIKDLQVTHVLDIIMSGNDSYTNSFYKGRPALKTAAQDPRVYLYVMLGPIHLNTNTALGSSNYLLNNGKFITEICTWVINAPFIDKIADTLTDLLTGQEMNAVRDLFKVIFILFGIALVLFILKFCWGFIKGRASVKKFFITFFSSLMSLGLVVMLIANPTVFMDITKKILTFGDKELKSMIDFTIDSEVVNTDDPNKTNAVTAALWEKSIFQNWVMTEFNGIKYEQLYTTFSDKDDSQKWSVPTEAAAAYGDISVPLGKDKKVKNWAALAYSCQSVYHINAVDKMKVSTAKDADQEWPKADRPSNASVIYTDDFRWIDANLRVGAYPVDSSTGAKLSKATNPWDKSVYRYWTFRGGEFGWRALWLSILMIPLGVIGFKKVWSIFKALGNFAILLYRSCLNVMFPGQEGFSISTSIKAVLKPLVDYLFYLILIFLNIILYRTMADSFNFLLEIGYFALAIYMAKLNVKDAPGKAKGIWNKMKGAALYAKGSYNKRFMSKWQYSVATYGKSVKEIDANWDKNKEKAEGVREQKEKLKKDEEENKEDNEKDDPTRVGGSGGTLTRRNYMNGVYKALERAVNKSRLRKWERDAAKQAYKELCSSDLRGANEAQAIFAHRSVQQNRHYDLVVLGIAESEYAKGTHGNIAGNYISSADRAKMNADIAAGKYNQAVKDGKEKIDKKQHKLDEAEEKLKQMEDDKKRGKDIKDEDIEKQKEKVEKKKKKLEDTKSNVKDDTEKLKKKAEKARKKADKKANKKDKFASAQKYLDAAGILKSGGLLSLKWKLIVVGVLLGIWLLMWFFATFFGV